MNKLLWLVAAVQLRLLSPGETVKDIREAKDRGAVATEYAMLVAFVAITLAAVMFLFAGDVKTFFTTIGSTIRGWATSDGSTSI